MVRPMTDHRFKIGDRVQVVRAGRSKPPGFTGFDEGTAQIVVRVLPTRGLDPLYHLRDRHGAVSMISERFLEPA